MTYLRHASRHVHHTVVNHLKAQLTSLGWTDAATAPFGATPAKVISTPAIVGSQLASTITAGTVSVTLGDEYNPDLEEMGGPFTSQEYPIFVDVFQSTDAGALTLASDIRDIFLGRTIGSRRWLDVINQATKEPVPGWKIELDDVDRVSPETVMPLRWQVVKVTATAYFNDVMQEA
jgi:hypothetical protein